jgi:hypothetical protein
MAVLACNTVQPYLLWPGSSGQATVLIGNRDETNSIIVSSQLGTFTEQSGLISDPNATIVDPLGFVVVDGTTDWYGIAITGQPAVMVLPGATYWSPSPGQIAEQISTLGLATEVTLLSALEALTGTLTTTNVVEESLILNANPSIPAGTTYSSGQIAVTQSSYELVVYANDAATIPFVVLGLQWVDTATNKTMDTDHFVCTVTSNTVFGMASRVKGPTKADSVIVTIQNLDSVTLAPTVLMYQNARNYTYDDFRAIPSLNSGLAVPNYSSPLFVKDETCLGFIENTSIGAGDTASFLMQPFNGLVNFSYASNGAVTGANQAVAIIPQPTSYYGNSGSPAIYQTAAPPGNFQINCPRGPVLYSITNNGSVTEVVNAIAFAVPALV